MKQRVDLVPIYKVTEISQQKDYGSVQIINKLPINLLMTQGINMTSLYLDHAATTPIIASARDAIAAEALIWANPSSPHREGRASKARLENYRRTILDILNWDGHILFTSGASEAIAMVMRAYHNDIYVSAGEHEAVLASSGVKTKSVANNQDRVNSFIVALTPDGYVDEAALIKTLSGKERALVAIQSVNNETGVIQSWDRLVDIIHAHQGIAFADCSQSAGKLPLPNADMIALSSHKFGGPPGMGALLVKDLSLLMPTGGQEQGYRRGTENGPYIAAMAAALSHGYAWMEKAKELRTYLDYTIISMGGDIVAKDSNRIDTIASYRMPGVAASAQLIAFDMKGIAISAGSACSSGTLKTSHVLEAMGYDHPQEVIRVSFGPDTNKEDIDRFITIWHDFYEQRR